MTVADPFAGADPRRLEEVAKQEAARRLFVYFVKLMFPGYIFDPVHRFLCCELQRFVEQVEAGQEPRLMIFLHPRVGKSQLVSRLLPAWVLGRNPRWPLMLATYGADLSEELSGDCRSVVQSEDYAALFGRLATEDVSEAVEIDKQRKGVQAWRIARHGGGLRAVGVGGAITGRGAKILFLDDLIKNREEADSDVVREKTWSWYKSTARTRLEPGGGILFTTTRWHHDDPAGRMQKLAEEEPDSDQWRVIDLPAIAEKGDLLGRKEGEALSPSRWPVPALLKLKKTLGSREWEALYMNRPTPESGEVINVNWFVRGARTNDPVLAKYQFIDTAYTKKKKSDRSVIGTWLVYPDRFRLEDVFYGRFELPELKKEAKRLYELHRPRAVIIEDEGSGKILLQEWRRESRLPILGYNPQKDGDKVARAHAVTPLLAAGKVEIPTDAPWLPAFLEECRQFPAGEHDDMVDMLTMALINMGVRDVRARGRMKQHGFEVVA